MPTGLTGKIIIIVFVIICCADENVLAGMIFDKMAIGRP